MFVPSSVSIANTSVNTVGGLDTENPGQRFHILLLCVFLAPPMLLLPRSLFPSFPVLIYPPVLYQYTQNGTSPPLCKWRPQMREGWECGGWDKYLLFTFSLGNTKRNQGGYLLCEHYRTVRVICRIETQRYRNQSPRFLFPLYDSGHTGT